MKGKVDSNRIWTLIANNRKSVTEIILSVIGPRREILRERLVHYIGPSTLLVFILASPKEWKAFEIRADNWKKYGIVMILPARHFDNGNPIK